MNFTNLFGTITAILTVVSTVMASVLKCDAVGEAAAACTASWLSPAIATYAAAAFGILTLVLKAMRPGGMLHSMFGQTAVVAPAGGVGVVTPAQVATK